MGRRRSIASALTTYSVMVAVLPVLVVAAIGALILTRYIRDDVSSKNIQLARSIAVDADGFLSLASIDIDQIARAVLADKTVPQAQIGQFLQSILDSNPDFQRIEILDPNGKVIYLAPFNPQLIGFDASSDDLVTQIRKSPGTVCWSGTFISPASGKPTTTVGMSHDGYIVQGDISLASLANFITRFKIGRSGFVTITDEHGTYIAHPDPRKVQQREVDTYLNTHISSTSNGKDSAFSYADGANLYSAAVVKDSGWAVIVSQPLSEAYEPFVRLRNTSILVLLVSLVIVISISVGNSRVLSRHIKYLVRRTKSVAAGDYKITVAPSSFQELNDLATSFNSMTGEVRNLIANLEEVEAGKQKFYRDTILNVTNGKLDICDQDQVSKLISTNRINVPLSAPEDAAEIRGLTQEFFRGCGLEGDVLDSFVLAAGEAIANALKHASGGVVYAGASDDDVWVAVTDKGPGIESLILPNALLKCGYSTKTSMGFGYSIMLDIADRLLLKTDRDGTTVILIKNLREPEEPSLDSIMDAW